MRVAIRRLIDAVRHHWLKAVGEFLLIVLGISVALAVNSWKDRRDASQLQTRYLRQLQEDFRQNEAELARALAAEREGEAAAIALLGAIHEPRGAVHNDSLRAWFLRAMTAGAFRIYDGTFSEMIQSGVLGIVGDPKLRSQLASFHGQLPRDLAAHDYWSDQAFLDLLNVPYLTREIGLFELYSAEQRRGRNLPVTSRMPVDLTRLVTQREFSSVATNAYVIRLNGRRAVQRLLESTQAILQELDRVIQASGPATKPIRP